MEKLNKMFAASETAEIDRYTMDHEPITSLMLMERASHKWTDCFLEKFRDCYSVVVIAGSGNNGGDGYAIARMLREEGVDTMVFRLISENGMSVDCESNYHCYQEAGGKIVDVYKADDLDIPEEAVVIDAIFGSGLNRPLIGLVCEVVCKMNRSGRCIVAVDIPSGLMGEDNSSNDREAIVCADYTFTFQFPKVAFMLPENAGYVGEWEILDIGLNREMMNKKDTSYYYITEEWIAELLPKSGKFAHKGINGRGLLVAGGYGMMGAAVLAAKAAVRSGIGLLYCHVPESGRDIIHGAVPEALLDIDESQRRFSGVYDTERYDAIAAGPAIGKGPEMVDGLRRLLTEWRGTTILDADALNILSEHRDMLELLHNGCILTPHFKEFERLAGKCRNDFDRLNKLSIFASRYHVYIILKGAHSVVATPDGKYFFNMSGNPGMAKGGAGDVLTGVLLGLASNGLKPLDVALIGVYAHGLAGDLVAGQYGMRGVCAGEIAEGMGKAWRRLEAVGRKKYK